MNKFAILAFVATPILVVFIGYVAVRLHERSLAQADRRNAKP